jgi:hypothetical protein
MTPYASNSLFMEEYRLSTRPARHGFPWKQTELEDLELFYIAGYSIEYISKRLGRTSFNACLKLEMLGHLTKDNSTNYFFKKEGLAARYTTNPCSETTRKETMKTLQQQTLIFGQDVSSLTSSSIIDLLSRCQEKRRKYQALEITSVFIKKELQEIEDAISILVAKLDTL